jgi:cytochrome c-type biogenesis protein CcmH
MTVRNIFVFSLLGLCLAFGSASAKEAAPLAEDPVVEARLVKISEELRCLVCQNESLASSRAELANDLREEVRGLIRQNKSDTDIKDFLVARYGDFVLYRPEIKPLTWLLWFGPFALFFIAVLGTTRYLRGRNKTLPDQHLSDADRLRAEALLQAGDKP